jgi:hypothetical protein
MRRSMLVGGLVTGVLAGWATPTPAAVSAASTQVVAPTAGRPALGGPADAGIWLRDLTLDRLTIPLGPADRRDCRPAGRGVRGARAIH